MIRRPWPRSLRGQLLLSVALALLLAQSLGAVLLYSAQNDRREAMLTHTAALRLFAALREEAGLAPDVAGLPPPDAPGPPSGDSRFEISPADPLHRYETRNRAAEAELREMFEGQGIELAGVEVFQRAVADDPLAQRRIAARRDLLGERSRPPPKRLIVAAAQRKGRSDWIVARVLIPRTDWRPLGGVIFQTLLIYALLVGAIAFILRRITRPLNALTARTEQFAASRDRTGQLRPEGPSDVRRLMRAHNALEDRIGALLDEKDVMLGAIGHDLKTPLAALRVRIECVADEGERAKMAATIEDIARSLDDILSLARVGRPGDPLEQVELSSLVAAVAEEYEDMGEPVSLADSERLVLSARTTWLKRALRNLIGNALRYGKAARVSLERGDAAALIRIEDDGPGILPSELDRMLEPFTRGDPSRSSETGGAGLGLTLARAIAEQHGGSLSLANRTGADGLVAGLTATLRLPLTQ